MSKAIFEKKLNKWIVGAVIGTTLIGIGGFGMSNKGKGFFSRFKEKLKNIKGFLSNGLKEMKKSIKNR